MVFRTLIVGHSQTPTHIPGDEEFEYLILRRPGGLLSHLESPPLGNVYNIEADLIVFFLGGNDIAQFKDNSTALASKIRDTLLDLKNYVRELAFVSIENREYQPGNRFGITTEKYEEVSGRVNRNIKRFCRNHSIRFINVNRSIFIDNISSDGTHFNHIANEELVHKITTLAHHAQARLRNES